MEKTREEIDVKDTWDLTKIYKSVDEFEKLIKDANGIIEFKNKYILIDQNEAQAIINKLKPSSAKGTYIKSVFLSSTMSKGLKIDTKSLEDVK